jgi:RNA polymerase sigma-70 factor (ECF subfamily)
MLSDEALYRRLVGGDMDAFDDLYRRYESPLFGFILNQLGDRLEAEDVFHEAFMSVLRERGQGEMKSFKAWIFQVARHLCSNRRRSRRRADRALRTESRTPADAPPHAENLLAAREAPEALRRALGKLPEPLARLYELRASGLSYEEIAELLEVPVGTVKSRMHDMISRLRKEVEPWTATR